MLSTLEQVSEYLSFLKLDNILLDGFISPVNTGIQISVQVPAMNRSVTKGGRNVSGRLRF